MMMMIGKTMIMIVNGDDASKFSLSIDAGGREADILAAGTTPLNSDPIVFTIIAIARGTIITITIINILFPIIIIMPFTTQQPDSPAFMSLTSSQII